MPRLCGLHAIDSGRRQYVLPGRSLIAVRIDDCLIDLIRLTIAPEIWALGLLFIPTRPIVSAIDKRASLRSTFSLFVDRPETDDVGELNSQECPEIFCS